MMIQHPCLGLVASHRIRLLQFPIHMAMRFSMGLQNKSLGLAGEMSFGKFCRSDLCCLPSDSRQKRLKERGHLHAASQLLKAPEIRVWFGRDPRCLCARENSEESHLIYLLSK